MKENMELRCVQTKMYVILKKIIYTHYFDFERASREGPAGPPLVDTVSSNTLVLVVFGSEGDSLPLFLSLRRNPSPGILTLRRRRRLV